MNAHVSIEAEQRRTISDLKRKLARRDEEVRQLRAALMPIAAMPVVLDLATKQNQILAALLGASPSFLSKDRLFQIVTDVERQPELDPQSIESHVSHLRRKIEPFGISIRVMRYVGYALPADSARVLRALIAAEDAP